MGLMDKFKDGMQQDMEYMNRVTKLNSSGIEHPATIKSMQSTGKTDMGGGVEYQIEVEVQPAGGSPSARSSRSSCTRAQWAAGRPRARPSTCASTPTIPAR